MRQGRTAPKHDYEAWWKHTTAALQTAQSAYRLHKFVGFCLYAPLFVFAHVCVACAPCLCCLCVRWGSKSKLRVPVWTRLCRFKALCLCGACCWDKNPRNRRHIEGESGTNSRFFETLDLFGDSTCFCGKRTLCPQRMWVGYNLAFLMCVHQSFLFLIGCMAPRTSLLCIDWGNYETWFCSPATVRHRASSASVRNQTTGARTSSLKNLNFQFPGGDGGKTKKKKNKKIYWWPTQKKPQPGSDGPNASRWYGRLCGPILPLSLPNSDQLWQQSFHVWHYLEKIAPSSWYLCITAHPEKMRLEMVIGMHNETWILYGHHRSLFKGSIEKRPVMTIEDFDLHFDEHFESHLFGNGL